MLEVHIKITGDADNPLSKHELGVLAALGGAGTTVNVYTEDGAVPTAKTESSKVAEKLQEAKPAAGRPEPGRAAAPAKAAPAKAAASPEPAAEEPADDEAKMELAVGRATALINSGDADELRDILGELGVKRVSELAGGYLDAFLEKTA